MKLNYKYSRSSQAGFSLVEIMVGLVIGMLATLVIIQVMSVFEGQKRSTTGTADAQTNGGIALYNIGRELQFAGYPLMPAGKPSVADSPLECTTLTFGGTGIASIDPVTITDGAVSDSITIRYGNSLSGGVPTPIGATPVGKAVTVGSNFGCQDGDIVFITQGATCAMSKLALATDAPKGVDGTTTVNLKSSEAVPAVATAGANLSCLGTWNTVTYAVVNGNLQRGGTDSVMGIVNVQAQYGVSATANSNQVTQWVDATAATGWAAPSAANRNRIKAIRIAIVARNAKMEPNAVTTACSSISAAAPTGLCAWEGVTAGGAITVDSPAPKIDLSGDANWARYHYRVYETIIPLRNMIWSKDTL